MNKNLILISAFLLIAAMSCKKNDSAGSTPSTASVSSLLCSGVVFNNEAYMNSPFSATASVPYTGGNGVSYSNGDSIRSTGVTGLTAVLQMGALQNGNGSLTYLVIGIPIGTPAMDSIANFPISFGGRVCNLQLIVKPPVNGGGGGAPPSITALNCSAVSFSVSTATVNTAYTATATIPYEGGNGAPYTIGSAISSTGVLGLSAVLQAGTLANGNGNFLCLVSGTPTSTGTAIFPVSVGGQLCNISLVVNAVNPATPSVTTLGCISASYSVSTATANTAYTAIATIPYAGGNGAAYVNGTAISSTGVTGLSAVLQGGTLANGNGNLSYSISGTPTSTGTATFPISFGGQSCSISLTVNTGATSNRTVYDSIYGAYSITYTSTTVTIKSYDQPNRKSVYWPTNNVLYEAFSGPTFHDSSFIKAPGTIGVQNITLTFPLNPVMASTHAATPMGVIGIGLDGVPFFNQYAAGGVVLGGEIHGFDQYWGHPQMSNMYHYHVEPKYLTTVHATKHSLMGFLLDGFPVYGPEEVGGSTPTGLDVYHGHTHATTEYPGGIYHYHFTNDSPYLNGNGFYGTKGTVTQ